VLSAFLASTEHLTSEELHRRVAKKDRALGLSTVYRTLRLFVEAGIASERHFQDGLARYEPVRPHHDHLICLACGEIVEFEDDEVERLQEKIARARGYRLVSHRHEMYGTCPACSK
jgi:Fur family ferric uptake transcriptional regulator